MLTVEDEADLPDIHLVGKDGVDLLKELRQEKSTASPKKQYFASSASRFALMHTPDCALKSRCKHKTQRQLPAFWDGNLSQLSRNCVECVEGVETASRLGHYQDGYAENPR